MKSDEERESALTLGILEAIDTSEAVTQRRLASDLGVALGLANSYLKRCVRKGLVKIHEAPANRYLYYLTPKGFAEKSRLTAEYLSISFNYYHRAAQSTDRALREMTEAGAGKVLFVGVSELAEIASVRAHEYAVSIIGTYDNTAEREQFLGRPVWQTINEAGQYDAILFTKVNGSQDAFDALTALAPTAGIYVPDVLGIIRSNDAAA